MTPVLRLPLNTVGRDYFVGDIHGEFHLLEQALSDVNFDGEVDRLISVGDLVDRGSQCLRVSEWLRKPFFYAVQGNHDIMVQQRAFGTPNMGRMFNASQHDHERNGGYWFSIQSLADQVEIAEALRELPYIIEVVTHVGTVGVIHADVQADDWQQLTDLVESPESTTRTNALAHVVWGRSRVTSGDVTPVTGIDFVVVGHSVVPQISCLGNTIFIDTGCGYKDHDYHNARLSLIEAREIPTITHIARRALYRPHQQWM